MNELLAKAYGTNRLVGMDKEAAAEDEWTKLATIKLDELEKAAEARKVVLTDVFTEEEVAELVREAVNAAMTEKTASEVTDDGVATDLSELSDEMQEKVAESDFLGRVQAHAFLAELAEINSAVEKQASENEIDEVAFDEAASEYAGKLLEVANAAYEESTKTAESQLDAALRAKEASLASWAGQSRINEAEREKRRGENTMAHGVIKGSIKNMGDTMSEQADAYTGKRPFFEHTTERKKKVNEYLKSRTPVTSDKKKEASAEDANVPEEVIQRALELLDANDYDVNKIVSLVRGE